MTSKTVRGVKINFGDSIVYGTTTGLRVGSRGSVRPAGIVYGMLSKGEARRLRKALHRAGLRRLAASPRTATN